MDSRILTLKNTDTMRSILKEKGRPLTSFKKGDTIKVWNKMEKKYSYTLSEDPGTNFAADFKPYATPGEMLAAGAFEGKYLNDCLLEFPAEWYWNALQLDKLRPDKSDVSVNLFQVDSRQPLTFWKESGWVPSRLHTNHKAQHPELSDASLNKDERGWFQWYCRYWMGRRIPELDRVQISRWKAFTRHAGQIKANCSPGDLKCRPRQRQGLFQWAHNPFI
jgi:hypothetical protein